jgi:signal transduction histidine kinase
VREHPGDPLSVVLIDDTPDIRLLLRMALEAGGRFRVVAEAGDGAAGVGEVARSQPDVVLVDLAMPVLDGLDALPALRRVCPAARIVVLSGFDSSRLLARTSAAGADGYLQKGLDPWDLEERLLRIAANAAPGLPAPRRRPPADLLERAPFGVLTLGAPAVGRGSGAADRPVRVLGANAAARELLGADRTEDREVHLPAELAAVVRAHTAALLAGGEPIEVDVPAPAGTLRVTLAPAPHGVAAYLVPARGDDSTWLRGAVAGAVHEIRNPAVVISGVVAALLGTPPAEGGPDLPREELLRALARQARLLDRATGDLLAAAQAQRGALQVDPRPVVLADVLASAVADAPGGEHVTLDCPPRLTVHADPERIQQMVHNLLANAAKYGSQPVTVRADLAGDGGNAVRVTVEDTGPGVPDGLVPALFEEFSRGPGAAAPGAGLGLSVVRSLARAQGGRAWYEPGGSGAVFVFTLPSAPPAQAGLPGRDMDAMRTAR